MYLRYRYLWIRYKQTLQCVHFYFFEDLWITHEFRGVDWKALARTVASPYIKAAGWFVSSSSTLLVLVVIGRRLVGQFHCHLAITNP